MVFCVLHLTILYIQNWNCMCVCLLIAWEGMYQFGANLACLCRMRRKIFYKCLNFKKLSWIWVLVIVVPVAQKLSTAEIWHPQQICLFWWGDNRNKGQNAERSVLGSSHDGGGFCSSESKHERRNGTKAEVICFGEEISETEATAMKNLPWVSILYEAGFRDNNCFLWYLMIRIKWSGPWQAFR